MRCAAMSLAFCGADTTIRALLQVELVQVFLTVRRDMALASRLVVAQQQVEHGFHLGDVLGLHLDQTARLEMFGYGYGIKLLAHVMGV